MTRHTRYSDLDDGGEASDGGDWLDDREQYRRWLAMTDAEKWRILCEHVDGFPLR